MGITHHDAPPAHMREGYTVYEDLTIDQREAVERFYAQRPHDPKYTIKRPDSLAGTWWRFTQKGGPLVASKYMGMLSL